MLFAKKTRVIIDTNFLLLPGTAGIDVVHEIEKLLNEPYTLCTTQATKKELEELINGKAKGKDKFSAKLGYIMIEQQGIKVLKNSLGDGYADQVIISLTNEKTIIATLDKALQKEVKEAGGRIITIQGKKLVLKQ